MNQTNWSFQASIDCPLRLIRLWSFTYLPPKNLAGNAEDCTRDLSHAKHMLSSRATALGSACLVNGAGCNFQHLLGTDLRVVLITLDWKAFNWSCWKLNLSPFAHQADPPTRCFSLSPRPTIGKSRGGLRQNILYPLQSLHL